MFISSFFPFLVIIAKGERGKNLEEYRGFVLFLLLFLFLF